jgi:hypothetical protein
MSRALFRSLADGLQIRAQRPKSFVPAPKTRAWAVQSPGPALKPKS